MTRTPPRTDNMNGGNDESTSLQESLAKAVSWLDSDNMNDAPSSSYASTPLNKAISLLSTLHSSSAKIKSSSLDDVSTSSLELMSVPFHLGRAYLKLPTVNVVASSTSQRRAGMTINSELRKTNIQTSIEYFHSFIKQLEDIQDLLSDVVVKDYHLLLDLLDLDHDNHISARKQQQMSAGQIRQLKIDRYQRKRSCSQNVTKLESMMERRKRLGVEKEEEMEGLDWEGLMRDLSVYRLVTFSLFQRPSLH